MCEHGALDRTPYYADDLTTIYHGDIFDVLPSLDTFDLIFTSFWFMSA